MDMAEVERGQKYVDIRTKYIEKLEQQLLSETLANLAEHCMEMCELIDKAQEGK